MCVAAARPNFMKVKPVVDALEGRGAEVCLVHTGQHYDPVMSDVFFEDIGLRRPDVVLGTGSGTHGEQTARVLCAFEPLVAEHRPDVVVVVGDVNSTLACALVAAKAPVELAHVEAGLRCGDRTMPEEVNRVVTDRLADVLLAPSPDAVANLEAEGCEPDRVHLVGNVMIDTLLANLDRARSRPLLDRLGVAPGRYGVLTLHRPANVDHPDRLAALLAALGRVARDCPLLFPVHPRARARLEELEMPVPEGIVLLEPLGYLDFLAAQASARIVLTDSGGVQEETTVLGVPCLTLRPSTERPITVHEGTNQVVGTDPDRIVAVAEEVLAHEVPRRRPALWDGRAGERIADVLLGEGVAVASTGAVGVPG
jgi:UDP-N-acetylglucosamine 2-epimerase (non-hydrolysing)